MNTDSRERAIVFGSTIASFINVVYDASSIVIPRIRFQEFDPRFFSEVTWQLHGRISFGGTERTVAVKALELERQADISGTYPRVG